MDLNQLLFHHQIALIKYSSIGIEDSSHLDPSGSHFDLVAHYAKRITRLREEMGVTVYPEWV